MFTTRNLFLLKDEYCIIFCTIWSIYQFFLSRYLKGNQLKSTFWTWLPIVQDMYRRKQKTVDSLIVGVDYISNHMADWLHITYNIHVSEVGVLGWQEMGPIEANGWQ